MGVHRLQLQELVTLLSEDSIFKKEKEKKKKKNHQFTPGLCHLTDKPKTHGNRKTGKMLQSRNNYTHGGLNTGIQHYHGNKIIYYYATVYVPCTRPYRKVYRHR